jgi:hypothetical protein
MNRDEGEQLLLRTRLEVLLSSVDQVGRLLKVMSATHDKNEALTTALTNLRRMHQVVAKHDDVRKAIAELRDGVPTTPEVGYRFDDIEGQLETLIKHQNAVTESVETFFAAWDKLVPMRVGDPETILASQLEADVDNSVDAVKARVQDQLDGLEDGTRQAPDVWAALYVGETDDDGTARPPIVEEASELFSEYVEVLGGIAMRSRKVSLKARELRPSGAEDDGSDDSLCLHEELWAMADQLMWEVAEASDQPQSAAVPARRAALEATRWRILRLGFDQWSVWAMPLAAYEFGMRLDENWRTAAEKRLATDFGIVGRKTLLADAIGACTLGPAYLAALCVLQLSPPDVSAPRVAPAGSSPTDEQRARFVLHRLQLQAPDSEMTTFVRSVYRLWSPTTADAEFDAIGEEFAPVDEGLRQKFDQAYPFDGIKWATVRELDPGSLTAEPANVSTLDIRDLLNFAWYRRIAMRASLCEVENQVVSAAVKMLLTPGLLVVRSDAGRPLLGRSSGLGRS